MQGDAGDGIYGEHHRTHRQCLRAGNRRYIAQGANAVLSKPLVLANLFETLRQINADNKV